MLHTIWDFVNLQKGEENKAKVLEDVTNNTSFRGSNLWILACAIIIASVGLNVNSTAVIIGAMLISPLMGPIVGAGFALGTYNFSLLKKSLKNLLIATAVSLVVSTFYFWISPFKDIQSELLARTEPTIYDVLIAFFGGLVGVIAITRVEKGNPIPGVAIATALMPPLCTAGCGLATWNFSYFFGAFYLYCINCFFICISTFIVVKYLKYPPVTFVNAENQKRIKNGISALVLIMILPSFYLAYNLWNEKKFSKSVEDFINDKFNSQGLTLIYKKVSYNSNPKKIDLAFLNHKFTEEEIINFNVDLNNSGLKNTVLSIKQDDSDLKSEILNEISKQENVISEKDVTINNLRRELEVFKINKPGLDREILTLFPAIERVSLGRIEKYVGTDSLKLQTIMLYSSRKKIDENILEKWLRERINDESILIVKY